MNSELVVLTLTTVLLVLMGLGAIVTIVILRPSENNAQIIATIATFLGPTILLFIQTFKTVQNSTDLKELKVKTNGNTEHQVQQAATVATLVQQVAAGKEAAQLAAKVAADTAIALQATKIKML